MADKYISKRTRDLRSAIKQKDVESLFWWIVKEHEKVLLDGEKSPLNPGLFRLSLDHLAKLQTKRLDKAGQGDPPDSQKELEQALRLVE